MFSTLDVFTFRCFRLKVTLDVLGLDVLGLDVLVLDVLGEHDIQSTLCSRPPLNNHHHQSTTISLNPQPS
jgi:hypothetical protein